VTPEERDRAAIRLAELLSEPGDATDPFVNLHGHTTFSDGDGFMLPEDHVARVAELGQPGLALTEHGNISSHVQLEQAANKAGVQPVF
jgi:DNA polymerase-3 subunit alpha